MALTIRVDDSQKAVFCHGTGTVTAKDIIAVLREINDQEFRGRSYSRLWDLREVSSLQISPAEATKIAHEADKNEELPKEAVVTASDLHFGLTRMAQGQTLGTDVKMFRDMEEAKKWLGFPLL